MSCVARKLARSIEDRKMSEARYEQQLSSETSLRERLEQQLHEYKNQTRHGESRRPSSTLPNSTSTHSLTGSNSDLEGSLKLPETSVTLPWMAVAGADAKPDSVFMALDIHM